MNFIKEIPHKIFSLSMKTKVRILSSFLCILLLVVSAITYFNTFSEMTIAFQNDPSYVSSKVDGNTVYVNDLVADINYYTGLNYTYSANGTLPTTVNKNIYNENNLVQTKITYYGYDPLNNDHGYVSPLSTERQDRYIYFKAWVVDDNGTTSNKNDDFVLIELIDNPFTYRPHLKGFNGWVTTYSGATISLDMSYYKRYAKVPITYTDNKPNKIEIAFYATWIDAAYSSITSFLFFLLKLFSINIFWASTVVNLSSINSIFKSNLSSNNFLKSKLL